VAGIIITKPASVYQFTWKLAVEMMRLALKEGG